MRTRRPLAATVARRIATAAAATARLLLVATGVATRVRPLAEVQLAADETATAAIVLALFITPGTMPGLAIDAVLLWAVLARKWRPAPLIGSRTRSNRPVTS